MSEESTARDERAMTGWHLLAFLGELVLWGCAAYAGWVLADGALQAQTRREKNYASLLERVLDGVRNL